MSRASAIVDASSVSRMDADSAVAPVGKVPAPTPAPPSAPPAQAVGASLSSASVAAVAAVGTAHVATEQADATELAAAVSRALEADAACATRNGAEPEPTRALFRFLRATRDGSKGPWWEEDRKRADAAWEVMSDVLVPHGTLPGLDGAWAVRFMDRMDRNLRRVDRAAASTRPMQVYQLHADRPSWFKKLPAPDTRVYLARAHSPAGAVSAIRAVFLSSGTTWQDDLPFDLIAYAVAHSPRSPAEVAMDLVRQFVGIVADEDDDDRFTEDDVVIRMADWAAGFFVAGSDGGPRDCAFSLDIVPVHDVPMITPAPRAAAPRAAASTVAASADPAPAPAPAPAPSAAPDRPEARRGRGRSRGKRAVRERSPRRVDAETAADAGAAAGSADAPPRTRSARRQSPRGGAAGYPASH